MGRNRKAVHAKRILAWALLLTLLLAAWDGTTAEVAWSTYLGGTGDDCGEGIAVDSSGNVYATGATTSSGWVSGGWDTIYGGSGLYDGYVVKLSAVGAHLWSTYLGGDSDDYGYGIAVDSSGNVYATGSTWSDDWVSGGWDTIYNDFDSYVVKLDTAGAHVWSTYLGGTLFEEGCSIAVDSNGNVYATGSTNSPGWVNGGWDTALNDGSASYYYDGYVVKLSAAGAHLWSTYLGGASDDYTWGIAVNSSGNVYATGYTKSSSGWVSGGGDTTFNGSPGTFDGYVVKLDTAGAHLWSTYLGGTGNDYGQGIAVDTSGNAYTTGVTYSSGWVSAGWDTVLSGATDGYVVKLDTAGAHLWSTYLGGEDNEFGYGIAVDSSGNAYATGNTGGTPPAWVSSGWNTTHNGGGNDAYVVKLNTAGTHVWSSYLGGTGNDNGYGIAVDSLGSLYVTGSTTTASGWMTGGWNTSYGGDNDGYVVKIDLFRITLNPISDQRYVGESYTATVATAYGIEPLSYQWTKNGTDILDETDTVFTLDPVSLLDAGTYACRVTDALIDTVTSTDAVLQVAEHIAITVQPESLTVQEGQPATFTVGISGGIGPISYQWRKDGEDITEGVVDQSAYTIGAAQMGDDGREYTCAVTDNHNAETIFSGEVPPGPATLTVIPGVLPVAGGLALATAVLSVGLLGALRLRR